MKELKAATRLVAFGELEFMVARQKDGKTQYAIFTPAGGVGAWTTSIDSATTIDDEGLANKIAQKYSGRVVTMD